MSNRKLSGVYLTGPVKWEPDGGIWQAMSNGSRPGEVHLTAPVKWEPVGGGVHLTGPVKWEQV